jgi:hypothetical protein
MAITPSDVHSPLIPIFHESDGCRSGQGHLLVAKGIGVIVVAQDNEPAPHKPRPQVGDNAVIARPTDGR